MNVEPEAFYHVLNQGNDRQRIFHNRENYLYFIRKVKQELAMHCHIIAYCLMPNHYHLLIMTPEKNELIQSGFGSMQILARKIGTLQSSHTRALGVIEEKTYPWSVPTPTNKGWCRHGVPRTSPGFIKSSIFP